MPKVFEVKNLYYITHIGNLSSIVGNGIFSHREVERRGIHVTPVYDADIVESRKNRITPDGKSLWNYANLYFQPRNPMLYRIVAEKDKNEIAILAIRKEVLNAPGVFVTTGNAASVATDILLPQQGLKEIRQLSSILMSEYWKEEDGSKRKIMAECLIPERVPPEFIDTIFVANHVAAEKVKQVVPDAGISIIPEPLMYFQPARQIKIAPNISLNEGDMFFSQLQTLTISVNTVGVMGKGLASRAKYQFPDVYVYYQDLCKQQKLAMGKPYLYKRESFLDFELADNPTNLSKPNSKKWFLLFPTKRHWKEGSDLAGIQQGLEWLLNNYRTEGVTSIAMPALGCGLGGLEWQDVGPLMCKYLRQMKVMAAIYLPREKQISEKFLTKEYLLETEA